MIILSSENNDKLTQSKEPLICWDNGALTKSPNATAMAMP